MPPLPAVYGGKGMIYTHKGALRVLAVWLAAALLLLLAAGCRKEPDVSTEESGVTSSADGESGGETDAPDSGTDSTDPDSSAGQTGQSGGTQSKPSSGGQTTKPSSDKPAQVLATALWSADPKTADSHITAKTADGSSLRSGTMEGRPYQMLVNGKAATKALRFTFDRTFLNAAKSKELIVLVECYGNTTRSFSLQYTSSNQKEKYIGTVETSVAAQGMWSGRAVRITDFAEGSALDGAHLILSLGTGMSTLNVSGVRVVIKDKEAAYPRLISNAYARTHALVADADVTYYGAIGDGKADDTVAFQTALAAVKEKGGGTVYAPAGTYKLTQGLYISAGVTLEGDFTAPDKGAKGTVLAAYTRDLNENPKEAPLLQMHEGSALMNLNVWYPKQTLSGGKATPYSYTVRMVGGQHGITVENVFFVNSYEIARMGDDINALETFRNIYGTPLKTGLYMNYCMDIARYEQVRFSPDWWLRSGLSGTPSAAALKAWLIKNATAMVIERNDWSYITDLSVDGYAYGLVLRRSTANTVQGSSNGALYGLNIKNCNVCLFADGIAPYTLTASTLSASGGTDPTAIQITDTVYGLSCVDVRLESSGKYAVVLGNTGNMTFENCTFAMTGSGARYALYNEKGSVSLTGVSFSGGGKHLYMGVGAGECKVIGMAASAFKADNKADSSRLRFSQGADEKAVAAVKAPSYAVRTAKPSGKAFIDLSSRGIQPIPFATKPESGKDIGPTLQKAIDEVAAKGGGVVYVPAGQYYLNTAIRVKSGVELRGSCFMPHHTVIPATAFLTDYGKNNADGTALFTLEKNAGLCGFTVDYHKMPKGVTPYAYTVRGAGSGVYVVNVTMSVIYQGIDLTGRCDSHYVSGVGIGALNTGISVGGGSKNGLVRDVQANVHYITDTPFYNRLGMTQNEVIEYTHQNLRSFVVSDTANEVMMNNFVFGAKHGIAVLGQADVFVLGHGTDSGIKSAYINGGKSVTFVNTQLVNLGSQTRNYILLDSGFTGTAKFINTTMWGIPTVAVVVESGTLELRGGTFQNSGQYAVALGKGSATVSSMVFYDRPNRAHFYTEANSRRLLAYGNVFTSDRRTENGGGSYSGSDLV